MCQRKAPKENTLIPTAPGARNNQRWAYPAPRAPAVPRPLEVLGCRPPSLTLALQLPRHELSAHPGAFLFPDWFQKQASQAVPQRNPLVWGQTGSDLETRLGPVGAPR